MPGASPCAPYSRAGRGVWSSPPAAKPRHHTTGRERGRAATGREGCARQRGARGAGCQAAHRAEARRRDGDIAPYRNGTAPRGTRISRDAKPRTAPMARRRDGDIAPYRQAARERAHGDAARAVRAATGHGMQSRAPRRGAAARWGHRALPTAKPHEGCARRCRAATGRGRGKWSMKNGFGNGFSVNMIGLKIFLLRDFHGSGTFFSRCAAHSGLIINPASEQPTSRTMRKAQMRDGSLKTEPLFRAIQACRTRMRGRGGVARQQSKFVL